MKFQNYLKGLILMILLQRHKMLDTIIKYWIKIVRLMAFLAMGVWCIILWYWLIKFLIIK